MISSTNYPAATPTPQFPVWRYLGRLTPLAILWFALVGWLGWLLYSRANWTHEADEADVREWLNETRVFRRSLPELMRDYVEAAGSLTTPDTERFRLKYLEIEAHLAALAEPTRKYSGKLPLFLEIYTLEIGCPDREPPIGKSDHPSWRSPVPRPGADARKRVRTLEYAPVDARSYIHCEFKVHTNHQIEEEQRARRYWQVPLVVFLVPATFVATLFGARFLRRERAREVQQWLARSAAEQRERELLETRVLQQEAERESEELGRKLLVGELEKAKFESRASEAERAALELKSQLYASIGIMAGSYAHNIKNLLVRPNDLLARCMATNAMTDEQHSMLDEVKSTLGTVTERLQQILRTVRRDPNRAEMTRVDITALVRESHRTWANIAWEKWKVKLITDVTLEPLAVRGDLSHLQQALENLVFNARDATFEMRNHLREEARKASSFDSTLRKEKIIEAAAWKGEVRLRVYRENASVVIEVRDNGIGMTPEVRENCLKTHFTTKRDNALYEGYNAGMGLGLSFVAVVLDHHSARLDITSEPLQGARFCIHIPLVDSMASSDR